MRTISKYYLVCFISFLSVVGCTKKDQKTYPQKVPLTESVYASATIQPDSLYEAYSSVSGILDYNLVEEGETVRKDQAIVQIGNLETEMNKRNVQLSLRLARDNYEGEAAILREIQDEIKTALLQLKNDSINYFRQKNLWEQNIGSKIEFDNRQLAYDLSQNTLRLLKRKYERTQNELSTQVMQAENDVKAAQKISKDFTIASKIDGTVYALYKNPGEIVSTNEPVAAVGHSNRFLIELLVDEVDIVKLDIGQKTWILLDAYGNQVFEAKLSKIYPKKDERSQTFKVEATFLVPPKKLYPGLSGEANIVIAEKDETLTIMKEYLIDGSRVLTDEGEMPVKIGIQSLDKVEILDGIDENTVILKPNR
ncbi:efflux RND transporter periplasmic adaptor subunit [Flagellimonas meridianipacifica]|uniref:Multidrug efflux pump subunit AcrA (Membrane-fusion protein) n=1 Tax=Flagellimonas meridianipacifica TaxID=1080225 RepID=A0A2T0MI31_9FLAO|nr:HlyD family efflux transporter periplasmic adaptor subunit [Allomuricauda pacifica]PRX57247.1 multidrug efflux pump subunit AcrA (membrane-fusion protein) [Allomuricauda pacifica]